MSEQPEHGFVVMVRKSPFADLAAIGSFWFRRELDECVLSIYQFAQIAFHKSGIGTGFHLYEFVCGAPSDIFVWIRNHIHHKSVFSPPAGPPPRTFASPAESQPPGNLALVVDMKS
jgi:hypothetical protein